MKRFPKHPDTYSRSVAIGSCSQLLTFTVEYRASFEHWAIPPHREGFVLCNSTLEVHCMRKDHTTGPLIPRIVESNDFSIQRLVASEAIDGFHTCLLLQPHVVTKQVLC
jgi:hypothetical protein